MSAYSGGSRGHIKYKNYEPVSNSGTSGSNFNKRRNFKYQEKQTNRNANSNYPSTSRTSAKKYNPLIFQQYSTHYKSYICPACNNYYDYFVSPAGLSGRIPRVLHCKHTMCQDCIINKQNSNSIKCVACSEVSNQIDQNLLDFNYYLMGHIAAKPEHTVSTKLVSTGVTMSSVSSDEPTIKPEYCGFGECTRLSQVHCIDCNGLYCTSCSTMLHKSGKSLMSHTIQPIGEDLYLLQRCKEHNFCKDFYCENCSEEACVYCFLEKHEGHTRTNLAKLNEESQEQFDAAIIKVKKVLLYLRKTYKETLPKEEALSSKIELEIGQVFTFLHASMFALEKELALKAKSYEMHNSQFAIINQQVAHKIEDIKHLLCCIEGQNSNLNLKRILSKLQEFGSQNCCLISSEEQPNLTSRLIVSKEIYNLEQYFSVSHLTDNQYKLVPLDEIPDNYKECSDEFSNRSDSFNDSISVKSTKQDQSENKVCNMLKNVSLRYNEDKQTVKDTFGHKNVYVTHINDPDSFYVQMKSSMNQLNQMNGNINKYIGKYKNVYVDEVYINDLYLCLCDNTNQCYRARVLSETREEGVYEVFFIDYGSTAGVPIDSLRPIPNYLAMKPPFAIHCKLENPSKENEWPLLSRRNFIDVVKGHEVIMLRKRLCNDINVVELNIYTSLGQLTSVTDLLICGYEALSNANEQRTLNKNILFKNSDQYNVGQTIKVEIRHIENPDVVYVQKASYYQTWRKLVEELDSYYENSNCDIQLPWKGTYVVVNYIAHFRGNWHRAEVREIEYSGKLASVFLVDWGLTVKIRWSEMRMLTENFRKTECFVIPVKMADLLPVGNDWSTEATKFLDGILFRQLCKETKMLVKNVDPIQVALFQCYPTYDECLNAAIVKKGLAISSGPLSQKLKWQHKTENVETEPSDLLNRFKCDEDGETDDETDTLKMQVEVVRIESLDLFFVKFHSNKYKELELQDELEIHYRDVAKDETKKWVVQESCVAYDHNAKQFRRGFIKEVLDDCECNVYLIDYGYEIIESNIYVMHDYFKKYHNFVFRCSLANVKPSGDTKNWSLLAIEWFKDIINKYKTLYIRKLYDNCENKIMPVHMWYSKVVQGSALEPTKSKIYSINNNLIKAGLALRIGSADSPAKKVKKIDPPIENAKKTVPPVVTSSNSETKEHTKKNKEIKDSISPNKFQGRKKGKPKNHKTEEDKVTIVKDSFIPCWNPPLPLTEKEFYAYVTCAESGGYLYIRDQNMQDAYKNLEEKMKEYFDSIPKPSPFKCFKDQMVTVSSNGYWYRGIVLDVIDSCTCKILMIDFGSDHIVSINDLHNQIQYPDIPTLASKIKLFKVFSKADHWLTSDVDYLLSSVCEYSKIVIRGNLHVAIPEAEVYDDKGNSLNDLMVSNCPNLYRWLDDSRNEDSGDDVIILKCSSDISDDGLTKRYMEADIPTTDKKLIFEIISVPSYNQVTLFIDDNVPQNLETLTMISEKMQEEAENLPKLKTFELKTACVSQYKEDQIWYRAEIYGTEYLSSGFVTVFYIDYGNVEHVECENLREIKCDWLSFPAKYRLAKVDVEVTSETHTKVVTDHMENLYGMKVPVEIIRKDPLTVHIYKNDSELYYDSFIQNDILKIGSKL